MPNGYYLVGMTTKEFYYIGKEQDTELYEDKIKKYSSLIKDYEVFSKIDIHPLMDIVYLEKIMDKYLIMSPETKKRMFLQIDCIA